MTGDVESPTLENVPTRADENFVKLSKSTIFWAAWSLFAAMLVGFIWNVRPVLSPNDGSRWDTVWSLVEYRTYEIFDAKEYGDKQQFLTIDKVKRRHDGKMISSKPPLLPTVAAGVVELAKLVIGKPFSKDLSVPNAPSIPGSINIYAKIVLIVFNVIPMLIVLILYRRYLDRRGATSFSWLFCLVVMAMGTLVTGYLVTFNNHTVAATSAFIVVYHLIRVWNEGKREIWRFALMGLLAGWTAANELPAGLFVIGVTLAVLWIHWRRTLLFYLPPLGLVTLAFFVTNAMAVGDPANFWTKESFIPAYLQKDLYQADVFGQPSYWASDQKSGIDALNDHPEPWYIYVMHSTIGHHGLFSLTPVLLLAVGGVIISLFQRSAGLRWLALPVIMVSLAIGWFYFFETDQRNYGGFCHGLRWMLWLTPVWLFFLPIATDKLRSRTSQHIAWATLLVSVVSVFDTWHNPWTRSWLHRILLYFGVIVY